jgi:acyl transferase domain-containing protein/NADPH:quinone reductase-like Zn-dependent oxidoreductase/acyl carrier protein/SAM-dependent methyltransferase
LEGSENSASVQRLKRALIALEKMQSRISELENTITEPIAIVGIGVRMPGGSDSHAQFWKLLKEGVDATSEVPPDRWDANDYYDADPDAPGKMYTRRGAFVGHTREFDAAFFRISPREALTLDPQQRLVMEVSWESLEDAGIAADRLVGSSTGVFLGIASTEYFQHLEKSNYDENDIYVGTGNTHSAAAGRLSFFLGVQGPSIAIDTACSSSLVSVHLACQSLRHRECDLALAGGVNRILVPQVSINFCKVRALSPDGRSKTFDASADGYGRGEGCGFVVLKRLSDALDHGDNIRAIILGSSVNHDGASSGLTVPSAQAQQAVLRKALETARVQPGDVSYVETHGTGTPLGDPIEIRALQAVYGIGHSAESPLVIGSVKTNIGHLEPAAGIAGLIKTVLALQHDEIPPHLHVKEPSPHIPWNDYPLLIPQQPMPWPTQNGKRIAGVSAFGFSGTNAHVIVQSFEKQASPANDAERPLHVLALSAKSENALIELADRYRAHLETESTQSFADICFTANTGRSQFQHRLAIVADSKASALAQLQSDRLATTYADTPPRIAFLFTGQGSQYVGMGQELYEGLPAFRQIVDHCDEFLKQELDQSFSSLLYGPDKNDLAIHQTSNTQPALFMIEYALARLWQSWGIEPVALIGHSIGEYVAACLAGVFSVEDALKLVAARGRLMGSLPGGGGMCAVLADEAKVSAALRPYATEISIAALNGPSNTVISGNDKTLDQAVAHLSSLGITSKRLSVSHAFHSPLMEPILSAFRSVAEKVQFSSPKLAVASNVFGRLVSDEMANPEYWVRQIREPVRFAHGINTLSQQQIDVFLEVGPTTTLLGMSRQCLPKQKIEYLPTLTPGKSDWKTLLSSVATLYSRGCSVNWEAFDRDYKRQRVVLPTYPFQRQKFWVDAGPVQKERARHVLAASSATSIHPLLGRRVHLPPPNGQALFENCLNADSPSFLKDHKINGSVIAPAAGLLEMSVAAANHVKQDSQWQIENVTFEKALPLTADETTVQVSLSSESEASFSFQILSCRDESKSEPVWLQHAAGVVAEATSPPEWAANVNPASLQNGANEEVSVVEFYSRCRERGIDYGPTFRGLTRAWRLNDGAVGLVRLPEQLAGETTDYTFHPALLDACLQPLGVFLEASAGNEPWVPTGIDRFAVLQQPDTEVWSYIRSRANDSSDTDIRVNAVLYGTDGQVLAFVENLHVARISQAALVAQKQGSFNDWFYEVQWRAQEIENKIEHVPVHVGPNQIKERLSAELPVIIEARPILKSYLEGFNALEEVCFLFILQTFQELGAVLDKGDSFSTAELSARLKIAPRHQRLFDRLLQILENRNRLRRNGDRWTVISKFTGAGATQALSETLSSYPAIEAEASVLGMCAPKLADILVGKSDPLQLLFPGGDLTAATRLYRDSPGPELMNHMALQAILTFIESRDKDETLRVIEIGGGTAATTSLVLPHLPQDRTEYTFTDISPLFVARARVHYGDVPFLQTRVVDIEKDPLSQGLASHSFDIIIASQVLHATQDLQQTLSHVRELLAPNGLLVMIESTTSLLFNDLVSGVLDGWWRFTDFQLRTSTPLLSASEWEALLSDCNFGQSATICPTDASRTEVGASIVLAQLETATSTPAEKWLVFADSRGIGKQLASEIRRRGDRCVVVSMAEQYQKLGADQYEIDGRNAAEMQRLFDQDAWAGVVYLWGLEATVANVPEASRDVCVTALNLIQSLVMVQGSKPPGLWLVTRGAIPEITSIDAEGLVESTLWGLGKVAALENPEINCALVDLDPKDTDSVRSLLNELSVGSSNEQVAIRDGKRFVARLARSSSPPPRASQTSTAYTLGISSRGTPENLRLEPLHPRRPEAQEVQVRVKATGMNFADVMDALGLLPFERRAFGVEFGGEISEVGDNVKDFKIGDRVFGAAPASFDSHVTLPVSRVRRIPDSLDFVDAATITVAFATAHYSLHQVANMKKGDRVLVHAAAGGVGLAAVQLAQLAGAEVFATAHPTKWQRLNDCGVQHVMNSRTTEFADQIIRLTEGQGVDIVLNSLTGDMIEKSLSVLKPGGRFIEIGKRDIWSADRVAGLREDIDYHVVDLLDMLSGEDNRALDPVLDPLVKLFADGQLQPLPRTIFPLDDVKHAFRYMQQAKQFGKVVVVHPANESAPDERERTAAFRENATYLIVGGLGGLGLVAAEWLIAGGARHIVLMGRREPNDETFAKIKQLESTGARITTFRGDVSKPEDVSGVLQYIDSSLPSLRGIIHSALVLDDAVILNQNSERFDRVFAPKVDGAWLLHTQTSGLDLDFFILFSAGASLLGNRGQANYAAANTFLDSLAHYRRNEGLPAMSINWGPWATVGVAAAMGLDERIRMKGVGAIEPRQGREILDHLYAWNPIQVGVLPIRWSEVAEHFTEWPLLADFRNESATTLVESEFLKTLEGLPLDQKRALIANHVKSQLAAVLGLGDADEISLKQGFFDLGMDSLTAVELRNKLQASLGFTLSPTLAFDYPTVGALIDFISRQVLSDSEPVVEQAKEEQLDNEDSALLQQVEQLTELDALASLKKKRAHR